MKKRKTILSSILVIVFIVLSINISDTDFIHAQDAPDGTVEVILHPLDDEFKTVDYWCGTTRLSRCYYGSGSCDVSGQQLCN